MIGTLHFFEKTVFSAHCINFYAETPIMKAVFFFSLLLLLGCKKAADNDQDSTVSPQNPVALSKAVKVWHGERVTGNLPTPTNTPNTPVLDASTNNQDIKAIAGRYAIVLPQLTSGTVAGYYVAVQGASDYFKIDYKKPRNVGGRLINGNPAGSNKQFRLFGADSTGGNGDSAIVISIPSTIQAGEFCITYCAYDSLGNISYPLSACITVEAFGGDGSVSFLAGTWHYSQVKYDTAWENVIAVDTIPDSYACVNNTLSLTCPGTSCTFTEYITFITGTSKADFIFGSDGALQFNSTFTSKTIDLTRSTCNNALYNDLTSSESIQGAWSYNATTQRLSMIFDVSSNGTVEPDVYEFTMEKISDSLLFLHEVRQGISVKLVK